MTTREKKTTIAPMMTQRASGFAMHTVASPRLLDGETPEQKAAREAEAAKKAEEEAAAKTAAEAAAKLELEEKLKGLSDSEAKLLKEQMATKEKLKAATKAAEEAAAKLKAFEGLDPDEIKKLVAAQKEAEAAKTKAEEERLKASGEFDRLKEMMAEAHKKEKADLEAKATQTGTALEQAMAQINELTVGTAFKGSTYIADELVLTADIARTVYGSYFENENGKTVGYNKPRGAEGRTKLVDGSGDPIAFDAALKKIVEAAPDKDKLLRSKLKSGTGSSTVDVKPGQRQEQAAAGNTGLSRITSALNAGALAKKK